MRGRLCQTLVALSVLGGCASAGNDAHVLSGQAKTEIVVAKADESARGGDFRAAVILYQQAASQEPSSEIYYRLGMSLRRVERGEEALRAFQTGLSFDPDHVATLERLGLDLIARGRPEQAVPHLERLAGLDPESWRAHNGLGIAADLQERFDDANAHYERAIELRPESAQLWNNLGYSRYLAGDDEGALQAMTKALRLDAKFTAARSNLALVLARQGDYTMALEVMAGAGDEISANADVGYLAFRMGDYDLAEEMLTRAIQLSPTFHQQAHRNLAAVRSARAEQQNPSIEDLRNSFDSFLDRFLSGQ